MPRSVELLWYVLGVGVVGVGALLIAVLVSRALARRLRSERGAVAFTLRELRDLRQQGQITQKEFEAMRAAVIDRTRSSCSVAAAGELGAQSDAGPDVAREGAEERPDDDSYATPDDYNSL